ncbi:hypothetical protein GQ43DRAFT_50721 [Delitschia confertaspora ATCC 74209]|uniref:Chromosome transmission fidelity protein 8 n=1 Tax=Delitschia confertaspora ATCC 74209 TaxID=1513339 RepID=A0A9P4MZD9_9PLEO|nr:hypothetical protein GQ43DRAFT_50721 [Delitschia confertaspora ATCC 74209]
MPQIPLRTPSYPTPPSNPLPHLLHTPSGLALLELQATIHFPSSSNSSSFVCEDKTEVGKLVFPLYNPALYGDDDTKWMKRVYFYVGKYQRLTGEVRKLGRPFAVVRRKETDTVMGEEREDVEMGDVVESIEGRDNGGEGEELEIVEVVRYKIVFSSRPEPVGGEKEEV